MIDRIRKLEIELIRAAQDERASLQNLLSTSALTKAVDALTFGCPECNAGGHTCPGDGNSIPHGAGNCGEHEDDAPLPIPNERRRLADYLSEVAHGTVQEWMRIVDVEEDILTPGSGAMQVRLRHAGDGSFIAGETQYSEEFGTYRLTVRVEALPDLPPLGPENDPAQQHEEAERFCNECLTDPTEDPRAWCDCGGNTELFGPCAPPCISRAHAPEDCPSRTEWIASTFLHIEQGDHLRIGQDEAAVLMVSKLNWHATHDNPYQPKAWEHVQVEADLGFGRSPFPSDTAVEILCDAERKAQLIMSEAGLKPRRA